MPVRSLALAGGQALPAAQGSSLVSTLPRAGRLPDKMITSSTVQDRPLLRSLLALQVAGHIPRRPGQDWVIDSGGHRDAMEG
jgi:hypothetical protein